MAKKIEHVSQENCHSCVHACLAMVSGLELEETLEFLPDREVHTSEFLSALEEMDIPHVKKRNNELREGKCYVVAVPSLNRPRGMHMLLIDRRWGRLVVHDPCNGHPDLEAYSADGSDLRSWSDTIQVVPKDRSNRCT